jgi:DNA-directed RNA polymerase subunit F
MIDPYIVLGVSADAEADPNYDETIRLAYLAAIRACPPERNRERFEQIRAAFESISNQRERLKHSLFNISPPTPADLLQSLEGEFQPRMPSEQLLRRVLGVKAELKT